MSYILQALRKAQTQRERTAQPTADLGGPEFAPAARGAWTLPLISGVLALGLVSLGVGLWFWLSAGAPRPPMTSAASGAAGASGASLGSATSLPVAAVPLAPPTVAQAPARTSELAPAATPAPGPAVAPKTKAQALGAIAPERPASAQAAASASKPAPVPGLHQMPQDFQQSVPKLVVQGSVAGESPAQRIVFISGQVWNEGAEPAPGLVIEQIRARELVLRWRGERFIYGF